MRDVQTILRDVLRVMPIDAARLLVGACQHEIDTVAFIDDSNLNREEKAGRIIQIIQQVRARLLDEEIGRMVKEADAAYAEHVQKISRHYETGTMQSIDLAQRLYRTARIKILPTEGQV